MARNAHQSPRMSRICPQCDYDLTGLPEPCVCPECGREIESGLRSVRVWPSSGKPSWIVIIVLGCLGLPSLLGAAGELLTEGLRWSAVVRSVVGITFTSVVLFEARKMWARLRGRTSMTLHSSPNGFGLVERGSLTWFKWRHVRSIRCSKGLAGGTWFLTVKSNTTISTSLAFVVLPPSRHTAAHVRNTLRRHLRAWRKANASPRR